MFWKKRPPQFDPEKHIGQLLLTLPKCTRRVIAIDGNLDQTFTCKYIILAESLLSWLEDFTTKVYTCGARAQATEAAFKMWLGAADRSESDLLARIPDVFFEIYSSYASELVKSTDGYVYCDQCKSGYDEIEVDFENTKQEGGGWHSGVEVWRCPEQHLLRQKSFCGHLLVSAN